MVWGRNTIVLGLWLQFLMEPCSLSVLVVCCMVSCLVCHTVHSFSGSSWSVSLATHQTVSSALFLLSYCNSKETLTCLNCMIGWSLTSYTCRKHLLLYVCVCVCVCCPLRPEEVSGTPGARVKGNCALRNGILGTTLQSSGRRDPSLQCLIGTFGGVLYLRGFVFDPHLIYYYLHLRFTICPVKN